MDNEMIERVSKAILETPNASDYETLVAINAIKAMREPTDKMLEAGREAFKDCWSLEPGEGLDEPPAPVIWEAMIDVVIND
jgi:hypothetical protein